MRKLLFTLSFALSAFVPCAFAQTGFPAFGSFQSTGFDAVNQQNLNAIFSIPISATAARGQTFQYNLVNNSLLWTKVTVGATTTWSPLTDMSGNPTWGWSYGPATAGSGQVLYKFLSTNPHCRYLDPDGGLPINIYWIVEVYSNFAYRDWQGSLHPFSATYTVTISNPSAETYCGVYDGTTGPVTAYSSDNTGFWLYASQNSTYVLSPEGVHAGGAPVDTNGNYVSQTPVGSNEVDWTDTAGHLALKAITNSASIQYEWADSSGSYSASTTTTVQLTTVNIKTNFGCSGVGEYTGTAKLPTEVDLPNGQKYFIAYEPTPSNPGYYTGRVQRVTVPTGGYYEYDYPTSAGDGIVCADASVNSLTRKINDGTTSQSWVFSRAPSGANWITTVTLPKMPYDSASNTAQYTFNATGQQTAAKFYALGTSLQRTVNTTWAANGSPATQITILDAGTTENEVETSYDNYGNLTSSKEHDWGSGTPGSILRTTNWTYLNTSPYVTANILDRPTLITVADQGSTVHSRTVIAYDESGYINAACHTGVPQHDDTGHGCSATVRGDPTTVTTYANAAASTGPVTHHYYYDNLGNLIQADMDCCQSKTWAYSATTNYSFPDSSTRGSTPGTQLTTSASYNQYTGLTATSTDENSQVTQYTFDAIRRMTNLQRPDSTNLTWTYNDTTFSVTAGVPIKSGVVQQTTTTFDALGRPATQQISDGTTTYSIVATKYDPIGRAYQTSNPYTGSPAYWTETDFDALGRPVKTILPDSSFTGFSYTNNTATVTDPAGKKRESVTDGLGRLSSVYEPDPSTGSLTVQTSYTYTVQDLLTGVTEGSQSRTYTFDDLGRATSVKTPETNQVAYQYQYNNFGLVTQRTDPRGVITTYGYDNLNRLQTIAYNVGSTGVPATANVTLHYDAGGSGAFALGRLTSMDDGLGVGSETYNYNNLGEITALHKTISGNTYAIGYTYNLAGEVTSISYPSGTRTVAQNYDSIGRLCSVGASGSGCTTGTLYASGFGYNPAMQVTGFTYGNGVVAAFGYSPDRLLLQSLAYTKGATTLFSTNYWYKTDSTHCPTGASGNNGQIQCITDNVDNGRSVAYSYDPLYRLSSAVTTGSAGYVKWGLSWTYDRYGNRQTQTSSFDTPPTNSVTVSATTNCITTSPYAYDANGNMTNDGNNMLTYDAENRVVSASNGGASGTYTFDGNNIRVKKVSGSSTTVTIFSGGVDIAEYVNTLTPGSPTNEYVYAGSQRIMSVQGGTTDYWHYDHLSPRLRTTTTGTIADQRGTYPFGENWYPTSGPGFMFTDYARDAESGNDYAMARSYVNRLARFSSPDPIGGSSGDPQSLNAYAYTENEPIDFADPTGFSPKLNAPALDASQWNNWLFEVFIEASNPDSDLEVTSGESYNGEEWMPQEINPGAILNFDPFNGAVPGEAGSGTLAAAIAQASCPPVPPSPPGVLDQNIATTQARLIKSAIGRKFGGIYPWFYNQVKTGGPWDYKVLNPDYEPFGNFNYGATGAAARIPSSTLLRAAGVVQVQTDIQGALQGQRRIGQGSPMTGPPYGDDPRDQINIQWGIRYVENHCYH